MYRCVCVVCSRPFDATEPTARYCSTGKGSCMSVDRWPKHQLAIIHVRWCYDCRAILKGTATKRCESCRNLKHPAPPFDCQVCQTHVIPGQDGHHWQAHRYCSKQCKRRAHVERERPKRPEHNQRRRARKRAAFIAPVSRAAIFERDGWRCQICMRPLARGKAVPHPNAPTIDHIIPLAEGGTHEPSNVQAAHFLCNARKGDRAGHGGDQLRLAA